MKKIQMKRSVMIISVGVLMLLSLVFAGCVDYKSYDLPKEEAQGTDLVNEIAQVERELAVSGENQAPPTENPNPSDNSLSGAVTAESDTAGEEALAEQPEAVEEVVEEVVLPELEEQPEETAVAGENTAEQQAVEEVLAAEETVEEEQDAPVITIKEN